jgi:hypothetical protein
MVRQGNRTSTVAPITVATIDPASSSRGREGLAVEGSASRSWSRRRA